MVIIWPKSLLLLHSTYSGYYLAKIPSIVALYLQWLLSGQNPFYCCTLLTVVIIWPKSLLLLHSTYSGYYLAKIPSIVASTYSGYYLPFYCCTLLTVVIICRHIAKFCQFSYIRHFKLPYIRHFYEFSIFYAFYDNVTRDYSNHQQPSF